MGAHTRSAANSPTKKTATASMLVHEQKQSIQLRALIGPRTTLNNSRLLVLKHPRDDTPTRFLFCPDMGLHELKKFSAPSLDPRSTILTNHSLDREGVSQRNSGVATLQQLEPLNSSRSPVETGHIIKDADLTTATPFDLSFILLGMLTSATMKTHQKAMFQPLDDILDIPESDDKHFSYLLTHGRSLVEQSMQDICDTVTAGDEKMFRYSEGKVMKLIIAKARRVVAQGLPASMEERFVLRPLESPVLSVPRAEDEFTTRSLDPTSEANGSFDSQLINSSSVTAVFSDKFSTSTDTGASVANDGITTSFLHLQRLRMAITFISSIYLPISLAQRLQALLTAKDSPLNFQALDEHLQHLKSLRAEALASRSMTDFSQKRGQADDDEAAEARAEKKRKLEEEGRKQKANISRGVRDLKKVNVTGMKKMSAFFAKRPVGAKAGS